jgi:hypothetical protein
MWSARSAWTSSVQEPLSEISHVTHVCKNLQTATRDPVQSSAIQYYASTISTPNIINVISHSRHSCLCFSILDVNIRQLNPLCPASNFSLNPSEVPLRLKWPCTSDRERQWSGSRGEQTEQT